LTFTGWVNTTKPAATADSEELGTRAGGGEAAIGFLHVQITAPTALKRTALRTLLDKIA